MRELVKALDDALSRGEDAALAMVVGRRGSLPMAHRAKMAVFRDGHAEGTVGGGCLEAEVYAIARRLIDTGDGSVDTFHLTEVEDGVQGHVCGGSVTILSRGLRAEDGAREILTRLRHKVDRGERGVLVARLGAGRDAGWALVGERGLEAGGPLSPRVLEACRRCLELGEAQRLEGGRENGQADPDYFLEPVEPTPTAVIFGAGHCGRAIAQVAALAGFRVHVHDDRPAFLHPDEMPWADTVGEVDFESLQPDAYGRDHYLVIVTRGHEHDLTILRRLLPARVAYMGMIGSRRKRLLFERTLRREGVPEERLTRLRSPMGLDIGADTPEEIAVAVVAEMIAARRAGAPGE